MAMNHYSNLVEAPRGRVSPASVRAQLERIRSDLKGMLQHPETAGVALASLHAAQMDELLRTLYSQAGFDQREVPLLIGAVGGYGRGVLGWKSDVDLCFITNEAPESLLPLVDELLYPLWDAGVSVGHQVLAISDVIDAAVNDIPTATELLDLRPVAGTLALAEILRECLSMSVFTEEKVPDFIERLVERTNARHQRFGDSVYLLEPDVKNGTGGLRDLDFALWAARARFGISRLRDLMKIDVLSAARVREVESAIDFLWAVRNRLHEQARRKADRLTFGEQESVARAMGYGRKVHVGAAEHSLQHTGAMIEAFMSDYYRHARVIRQVSEQILGHAMRRAPCPAPHEQTFSPGIVTCEGGVGLENLSRLKTEPALALQLFAVAVGLELPVLSRSRDAVIQAASEADFGARLRNDVEAKGLFVQLVGSRRRSPFPNRSIVGELHEVGLLLAMVPEFAPVVGRVHHDIYHVYTVDVHSVAAVDHLHAMARGELTREHPLATSLAAEVTNHTMLALATLLHDVGKAIGGHDHASRGAEMARTILQRLELPAEDIDDACHLIDKHLALYVVAARRDLGDPATIRDFASEVWGREGLRDLYLLTVADLSTTSPNAMTKWKAGMMDELWRATDAFLAGSDIAEPSRVSRLRAQVRALWPSRTNLQPLDDYLDSMPERYLLANTPAEIVAHALIATEPREGAVAASLVATRLEDVMELCVVTEGRSSKGLCVVAGDRPGLLAGIAAAISGNRLRIQAAQIHSRTLRSGGMQAVDLFWVHVAPGDDLSLTDRMRKLQRDLNAVITNQVAPRDLVKRQHSSRWTERALPAVATEVVIEHQASSQYTVIEVLTQDRPALLFELAECLHALGLTIRVAKISTEGTRVIDVFYVNELDGNKVAPGARTDEVRERLLATLR
ncbi:MAG: [protein-PII] uridylyltransferase [Myxococcales bacterium]